MDLARQGGRGQGGTPNTRTKLSLWRHLEQWWFAPFVPERLALLRVCVGAFAWLYLLVLSKNLLGYRRFASQYFAPVGPVAVLLEQPLDVVWLSLSLGVALGLGPAFIWGYRFRLTGPLFALLVLWLMSYHSSWGMVFHTDNLMVFHLLILAVVPAADACSIDARRRLRAVPHASASEEVDDGRYGWPVRLMCIATTLTYAIAGWAKWDRVGPEWFVGETLRRQIAYDNLRKLSLGAPYSPVGVALLEWEWVFPLLACLSFLFEFGAPLALCGARVAWWWVLGMWSFHVGVLCFMAILFPYPLCGVAFLSFFALERLCTTARPGWRRFLGAPQVDHGSQ
ncbi:MAG: hypothetical protein V3U27_19490 [Candidatus Tectomicrobia bacterium]